jgi:Tol biopolymer transport system component
MNPRLSRDNSRVVVAVDRALGPDQSGYSHTSEHSIWVVSTVDGSSQQITDFNQLNGWPWDWSADQKMVLASSARQLNDHWGLYLFPIGAAPHAENQIRLVTERPGYEAYGGIFSPNEQWITFEAGNMADVGDRHVYVVSVSGGEWIPISPEGEFGVGGCWSPDGGTLYFRLNRGGFVNIWGRRFDPVAGKPIGEPFRVTNYETLGRRLDYLVGVAADRLVLRFNEISGGIWMLDSVNR